MRKVRFVVAGLAMMLPLTGCMAVSSHTKGVGSQASVVVYRDRLYVVNTKECTARRVILVEEDPHAEYQQIEVSKTD